MGDPNPAPPTNAQPGLVKTAGWLSLVLGGVLFLCGGGALNATVGFLRENTPLRIDPTQTQEVVEEVRRQMLFDLRNAEAGATAADKERLRKTRADLEAKPNALAKTLDFDAVNGDLVWVSRYLWADLATGPLLNLGLIASGVGLVRVREWGRKLGVWVAALKIIRLAVLSGLLAAAVVPAVGRVMTRFAKDELMAAILRGAMDSSVKAGPGGALPAVKLDPSEIVAVSVSAGYGYAAMSLGLGSVVPAVVLILLTRDGARAACRGGASAHGDGPGAAAAPVE